MTSIAHDKPAPSGEPPAKRVRFAAVQSSNDAVHLAFAGDAAQVTGNDKPIYFSPKFTYHAFGTDEQVEGYEGLSISIIFSNYDFKAFVAIEYDDKEPTAMDLIDKLKLSLPPRFTADKDEFQAWVSESKASFAVPGSLLTSYDREVSDEQRHFEIYECHVEDNEQAQALLENAQTTALWFIEGADAVDVQDRRWVLYIIYERPSNDPETYIPVGYVTLFKFAKPSSQSPFGQVEIHRICQVLIYPPYQRQGHCETLVNFLCEKACANERVSEVTVEDPVPGFSAVRDLVDAKRCIEHKFFSVAPKDTTADTKTGFGTNALSNADIQAVQQTLKITRGQVRRCYELFKLRLIDRTDQDVMKKFRLEVKKRLFKENQEELDGMGSADRRKAFLEAEYQQLEQQYDALLLKIAL